MNVMASARCRTLLERLSRYVDADLTAAERRIVTAHLRRCACCRGVAEGLKQTVTVCRGARTARLPAAVRAMAKARVEKLLVAASHGVVPPSGAGRAPRR